MTQHINQSDRTAGRESDAILSFNDAALRFGNRTLWQNLSFAVQSGEFIAILGPNGAGKSTLLQTILGLQTLSYGQISLFGQPPKRGNHEVGYVPQQKNFDAALPLRGRDLVQLGLNGHRFGVQLVSAKQKQQIDAAIHHVDATAFADNPVGLLSGGEQQRLRIAQALVSQPRLLLCDEPLLSLDLASQQTVARLVHGYRQDQNAAVLFVTHEINPVLPFVDKILYIANQKWVLDKPENVLRSNTLSDLYGTRVEVLHVHSRILIVGTEDAATTMFVDHIEGHHA